MKTLALIPARGGSKGIKDKNIVDLGGKPLIYYTIREAKIAKVFNRILVSTDSHKIKQISESYGIDIPFMRPKVLAQDNSRTIDVVLYALDKLKKKLGEEYDYVCLLQPTSPLRMSEDILNCINMIGERASRSVISLVKIDEPHPYKMKIIKSNHIQSLITNSDSSTPRQELPDVYALNGAIYLTDIKTITEKQRFINDDSYPYLMPYERSVNINNVHDLDLARLLFKRRKWLGRRNS